VVRLIYFFILTSLASTLSAQQTPVFHHLTLEDGLAQNTVTAITQDSRGFLWMGTPNGLSRFDSKEFKNYKHSPKNPGSILSDYILSLHCDSRGALWVGTNEGLSRYNPDTDSFSSFLHNANDKNSLGNNTILSIYEDSRGCIWVGTENGLNCLAEVSGQVRITRYLNDYPLPDNKKIVVRGFVEDAAKNIWCATSEGLVKINPAHKHADIHFYLPDTTQKNFLDNTIYSIALDQKARLWVGTTNGKLYTFNTADGQFSRFSRNSLNQGAFSIIYKIMPFGSDRIWIGTNNGLVSVNLDTQEVHEYFHDAVNNKTLNDNGILAIFEDRQHTLWLGTYYGGVNYMYAGKNAFQTIRQDLKNRIIITKIIKDRQGQVWMATSYEGLMRFDKAQNTLKPYPIKLPENLKFQSTRFDKDGLLWVGNYENSIFSYDMKNGALQKYWLYDTPGLNGVKYDMNSIEEDDTGKLWIGNSKSGLYSFDKKTKTVVRYSTDKNSPVRLYSNLIGCLKIDKKKNLWIGTNDGVQVIRPDKSTQWFPTLIKAHASSFKGAVVTIHEDDKGRIWFGTFYAGLKRYDATKNALVAGADLEDHGDMLVSNILSDNDGYLWLSSERGLIRYHPEKKTVQKYDFSEGLPGQEIIPDCALKDNDGEMFFSTNEGVFHFYPKRVPLNTQVPSVVFTQLKLFNRPVAAGDSTGLLDKEISKVKSITFRHYQSIFTVDFAVLNFIKPQKNEYAYMLEGFEHNWNYVRNPAATYTNLPAGTYTLLIKGANNDGVWNHTPTRLSIVVLPPWWKTDFAYAIYCVVTALALFLAIRFFWIRETFQRETELYQTKLDFFTNISHEIRTHLTLISGPINNLLMLKKEDAEIQTMLGFTKRNTDLLLNLVSELLDLSKIQNGLVKLSVTENDLNNFLKTIISSVDYLFIEKGLKLDFSSADEEIKLWFDTAQLQKVIYNLLINAYKFTPKGGSVNVTVSQTASQVQIRIIDNGIGILPQYIKKIFSNFFQGFDNVSQNTGYGVGLALSKSIVELHKGELLVDSQIGQLQNQTSFTIALLKGNSHLEAYLTPETDIVQEAPRIESAEHPIPEQRKSRILVVEDNEELRAFISTVLARYYEVTEAGNGREAWEIVSSEIPDVVISDIMMTEMNGLELCRKIKSDDRTSHIPVVILTAKTGINNEIEGLSSGADLYLSKPFNVEVLLLNLKNLLENHRLFQQKYYQSIMAEADSAGINQMHDKFLTNIIEAVEKQIAEQHFSVHELSHMTGMSLTVLYKKLKAVTGMTVNEFVKSVQMNKAARLLRTTDLTISEVSYKVGFEDRKYFSKEFKKRFGKTPSEYAAENRTKV
jgi:ligand-binding sensor domain-containing protein/signal transduction histidine kinase/DNA-binding response OmpR family regulator